jgi:tryptophan-rich sensory protein
MNSWIVILIFALVCAVVNIFMYMIGWYGKGKHGMYAKNKFLPPGFLIGLIWIGIFASLGYAFYLCYTGDPYEGKTEPVKWNAANIAIIVVASYCLLYPFLTMIMHERYVVVLNLLALLMAAALAIIVVDECVAAFWYVLPLLVWCSYIVFADVMQYTSVIEKYGLMGLNSKSKSK